MCGSRVLRLVVLGTLLYVLSNAAAQATCLSNFIGFSIFQCANEARFGSAPFALSLDANGRPTNVSAVFWQVGFGNNTLNTGQGTAGTGNSGSTTFNGNDNGLLAIDLVDF